MKLNWVKLSKLLFWVSFIDLITCLIIFLRQHVSYLEENHKEKLSQFSICLFELATSYTRPLLLGCGIQTFKNNKPCSMFPISLSRRVLSQMLMFWRKLILHCFYWVRQYCLRHSERMKCHKPDSREHCFSSDRRSLSDSNRIWLGRDGTW